MASRECTAVPRQRGDKMRPPSAALPDAVPGRLSEAQWLSVLAAEEGDDDVGDAVAELLGAVVEHCFQAALARQCVPFAVEQARAELLQVAAWRFLARDEGDAELEAVGAWQEDEEPVPCATDAWAEGAVPILRVCPTPGHREAGWELCSVPPAPLLSLCPGQVSSTDTDAVPSEAEGGNVPAPSHSPLAQGEVLSAPQPSEGALGSSPVPALLPATLSPSTAQPRHLPGTKHPEPQARAEDGDAAEADGHRAPQPPSCSHLVKIGAWRSPRSAVRRSTTSGTTQLSAATRWIQPQVEVLDTGAETTRQPRPLRHQRRPQSSSGKHMEPGSSWSPRGLEVVGAPRLLPPILGAWQPGSTLSPVLGSLLGTVQLAPGVTIRRGGSEGHRLCLPMRREDEEEETGEAKRDLRPLHPTVPFPPIAVSQVTGSGTS